MQEGGASKGLKQFVYSVWFFTRLHLGFIYKGHFYYKEVAFL